MSLPAITFGKVVGVFFRRNLPFSVVFHFKSTIEQKGFHDKLIHVQRFINITKLSVFRDKLLKWRKTFYPWYGSLSSEALPKRVLDESLTKSVVGKPCTSFIVRITEKMKKKILLNMRILKRVAFLMGYILARKSSSVIFSTCT